MDRVPFVVVIVVAIIVAIPAAFVIRNQTRHLVTAANSSPPPSESPSPSPTEQPSLDPVSSASPTVSPTSSPISTPQPTGTSQPQTSQNDWQYPNSSGSNNTYTSADSPDTITNWYKEKIKSLGMNTTSFVTTNTNGNVLNKLAGAGNGRSVSVEIKKNSGDSQTTIIIKS